MVETLQSLKDVSGWDVVKVDRTDVRMVFKGDIYVSFNVDELARGGFAKVDIVGESDVIQQFTYSALSSSVLKGDVRTVCSSLTDLILDIKYNITNSSSLHPSTNRTSHHKIKTPNDLHPPIQFPDRKYIPPSIRRPNKIPPNIHNPKSILHRPLNRRTSRTEVWRS